MGAWIMNLGFAASGSDAVVETLAPNSALNNKRINIKYYQQVISLMVMFFGR